MLQDHGMMDLYLIGKYLLHPSHKRNPVLLLDKGPLDEMLRYELLSQLQDALFRVLNDCVSTSYLYACSLLALMASSLC